jgi:hypothetical protein
MNPLGITLTLFFGLAVCFASSRWAALALMATICYVTQGQQINVLGFHFTAMRLVLLAGIIRCVVQGNIKNLTLNGIDWVVIGFATAQLSISTIREHDSQVFTNMLGITYDALLSYFLFRCLISNVQDAQKLFSGLTLLIVPFAGLMALESITHYNAFSAMGGQGWQEAVFREGRLRCVGSFRGPHTAGVFAATMVPLFFSVWFEDRQRIIAAIGLASAALITYCTNSSGPLTAFVFALIGLMFWPLRHDMKWVRRGIVAALVGLHLCMNAPVWFLFAKMGAILGGDGGNRSYVIDVSIRHFSEWWLLGKSNTIRWLPWAGPTAVGELDLTDQYVGCAMTGGLLSLIFFILIFVRCFRNLGFAMTITRPLATERFMWCLGAALFAHVMALFSVGYFDQMQYAWWGLLAIIASTTTDVLSTRSVHATICESTPTDVVSKPSLVSE